MSTGDFFPNHSDIYIFTTFYTANLALVCIVHSSCRGSSQCYVVVVVAHGWGFTVVYVQRSIRRLANMDGDDA